MVRSAKRGKRIELLSIFAPLHLKCPGGETGRRTVFRSQRSQGCAGSNPVLGTLNETLCKQILQGVFYLIEVIEFENVLNL